MINKNKMKNEDDITHLKEENTRLHHEIVKLREELYLRRDELHDLQNSRILGRIIKTHHSIGNPRTAPIRAMKKVRKSIGRRTPDLIRIPVGRLIRIIQNAGNLAKKTIDALLTKHVTIENTNWGKSPLVSVVIPYYNRHDTIEETLNSLMAQTFINFEIILVDDGSSDKKSVEKLKELRSVSSLNLKIIYQENQGVAVARNTGIHEAKGKYIVCLDSDDKLDPTYLEKSVVVLETTPDAALITSYMNIFGVKEEEYRHAQYNPIQLYKNNMVITAAMFKKEAWQAVGGYRSKIGYEDWEFWINLAKNGFWGRQIPEALFNYRTALSSRYIEDKDKHWNNVRAIRTIHSDYKRNIRRLTRSRQYRKLNIGVGSAFINLNKKSSYNAADNLKPNVLVAIPGMTFGGAETLLYNFCRQTSDSYNVSFITGLKSENQWEYKFKEISDRIYHLPNLFADKILYVEFISNYIETRNIDILHIVHTDYMFDILAELKRRHQNLKIIVTMFNDRVISYVNGLVENQEYVDILTSDNEKTAISLKSKLAVDIPVEVIPNGIDSDKEFSPLLYNREEKRAELGLKNEDMSVFFVGRLSEEKNPDIFVRAAKNLVLKSGTKRIKFYIIGDGPSRQHIDRLLYGVDQSRIQYLGYQSEIAQFLSAADVFVLPSSIEGFPLSILEAMAMKVAVVASSVGAVPDVIQNGINGYIIKPKSVNDIMDILIYLDSHRDELEKIKNTGRKDVDKMYSHKKLGEHYRELYRKSLR